MPIKKKQRRNTEAKERNLQILKCDVYFWHTAHKSAKEFLLILKEIYYFIIFTCR